MHMSPKKRAPGRPKKSAKDWRSIWVTLRLSPAEQVECDRAVGRAEKGVVVRDVVLRWARETNRNK